MTIRFLGPRLPTAGLPDDEDVKRLDAQRDQEAILKAAADSEPQRRAERTKLRAATHQAAQNTLKA